MSGFITTDGADYLMNLWSGIETVSSYYFIALVTEPVGSAESGDELVEPDDVDYFRTPVDVGPENWTVAYGSVTNTVQIALAVPSSVDWTGIVGWAICDSEVGGRILWAGDEEPFDISVEEQTYLPAGSLSLSLDMGSWRETT
jgi:hypothetical protein